MVSTKQSVEPESTSARKVLVGKSEAEDMEGTDGDGETEGETDGTEETDGEGTMVEPGAYSLEVGNRPLFKPEKEGTGKETGKEREEGSDRPDAFKRKTSEARGGHSRPTGRAWPGGSPSNFLTLKSRQARKRMATKRWLP